MNEIKIFQNEQFGEVRIAMNENEEPLFCLADVCKVLELRVDAVQSRIKDAPIRFGVIAEPFQDWVCGEVLPSIRKHGGYITAHQNDTPEEIMARALIVAQETLKRKEQRLIEAESKIQQDAPKVLFADAVSTSQRSCLIAELAKILQQNGVNIGQNRLFSWMRDNGYLCQKGDYYNQPTQKSMKLGLFELKKTSITKPDGSVLVTTTTKVTGKGQIYFVNKFLGKDAA